MFGEQSIYGTTVVKIDQKGRIFLPEFTKVSPGDKLILRETSQGLEIISLNDLEVIVADYKSMIDQEINEEKRAYLTNNLYDLYRSIKCMMKVDSYNRINLQDNYKGVHEVKIIGIQNGILLEKIIR